MSAEQLIRCPYCGSEFKVPHAITAATCPYCGYTFRVDTGKAIEEHYYFKVIFSSSRAFTRLMDFIARNYGAPADLKVAAVLRDSKLHYVPIHAVHAEADGECNYVEGMWFWRKSYEGDFVEVHDYFIPGTTEPWFTNLLRSYKFSLRGREYFKPKMIRMGKYYGITVPKEAAISEAERRIKEDLMSDLRSGCAGEKIIKSARTEYLGVTHYPIWEFTYEYKGIQMKALVDASSGRVIYAEHPQTLEAREKAGMMGAGIMIAGLIGGLVGGLIITNSFTWAILSGIGGLIIGAIAGAPALSRAFKKVVKTSEKLEEWSISEELLEKIHVFP